MSQIKPGLASSLGPDSQALPYPHSTPFRNSYGLERKALDYPTLNAHASTLASVRGGAYQSPVDGKEDDSQPNRPET